MRPPLLLAVTLFANGCLGLHAGAIYDHAQHELTPLVGVSVEGFGGTNTEKATFGAAARTLYPVGGHARVSLQPEANVPVVKEHGNLSVAAGVALGPSAFHGTLCYRNLEELSYGGCGHWYSDGSVGADLNVSLFLPILFANLNFH